MAGSQPGTPGSARIERLEPIMNVRDVAASIDYYVNALGFQLDGAEGDPPVFASVSRQGFAILLHQAEGGRPGSGSASRTSGRFTRNTWLPARTSAKIRPTTRGRA
jgi:catechol 2,3-dioxygenase-like lactoylglutathione lyase family enzyme